MSYARFGWYGSQVYVFTSSTGIECCGCWLQKREWVDEPDSFLGGHLRPVGDIVPYVFDSNAGMIEHLERHRAAGYHVPDDVFAQLRDPADEAENVAIWAEYAAKRRCGPLARLSAADPFCQSLARQSRAVR